MDSASISARQDSRRWGALAIVIAAQFMVILDVAIVNVALPSIKDDLGFSEASLQWVITAYAIVFGGALLLGGRLADLFGRRRVFLVGMGLFTVSSLLSGLAWSEGALIVFRGLQGLGGALLAPAALSILMTTFSEGRERNLALGIWGAASGSGAAAGVLLGGVLTSYLDWSWIFFINIPVGLAVMALTPWLLAESRAEVGHRHFDLAGAVTVTAGVMLLVYAMTRAAEDGWLTPSTLGLLSASVVLLVAFLIVELRTRVPLLPLRIFRQRTLAVANATAVLVAAVAFSEFFLLTLYLQQVLDFSPVETGLAFLPITLTIIVVSNVAQTLVTRIGVRPVLTTGLVLAAGALAYFARLPADGHYARDVFGAGAQRRRPGAHVRSDDDRGSDRGRARRRRRCLRAHQHEPPDRRRRRPRGREHDRHHRVEPRGGGRELGGGGCGPHARLPGLVRGTGRPRDHGRRSRGCVHRAAAAAWRRRDGSPRGADRCIRGGSLIAPASYDRDAQRRLDDIARSSCQVSTSPWEGKDVER